MPSGKPEKKILSKECKACGKRFETTRSRKEFCHPKCKNKFFNESKVFSYLKLSPEKIQLLRQEAEEKYGASGPREINQLVRSKL